MRVDKSNAKTKYNLSCITAEFRDRELEKEFYNFEFFNTVRYLKRFLLILTLLLFIPMTTDFFLIKSMDRFWIVFALRMTIFAMVIASYVKLKLVKAYSEIYHWVAPTEVIIVIVTYCLFYFYDSHSFLVQTLNVSITLIFIYFIPNRYIYMIINSVIISAAYFIFVALVFKDIDIKNLVSVIVYYIVLIIMSSISAYRTNHYKRIQFVNKKELYELLITDTLTGVYNRLKFDEELNQSIIMAKQNKTDLSIILLDIDNFKSINDNFGHLVGDKVLVMLSELIAGSIRENDVLARWGGEEFTILLPQVDKEEAVEVAERLRSKIYSCVIPEAGRITCSFGVAYLSSEDNAKSLLINADKMLYMAKEKGKNRVES